MAQERKEVEKHTSGMYTQQRQKAVTKLKTDLVYYVTPYKGINKEEQEVQHNG